MVDDLVQMMAHMLVMVILPFCLLFAWQRFRDVLTMAWNHMKENTHTGSAMIDILCII